MLMCVIIKVITYNEVLNMNDGIPISFEKEITKIGESYGIIIPKAIAQLLNSNKKYKFTIEEVIEDEVNGS